MLEAPLRLLSPEPQRVGYPLFVFLPGMDGTGQLLQTQLSSLYQAFNIRCLALSAQNNWGLAQLADRVISLLAAETAGQSAPIYLCGESFGGCLALQVAVKAPQLIDRLLLVNPASSFRRLPWMRWGANISTYLPSELHTLSMQALMLFLIAPHRVAPAERQALWQAMTSVPSKTASQRLDMLKQFDVDQLPLAAIQQPTLLIAGQADRLLPSVAEIQRLAQILPDAQTLTLPDSGHACLLETEVDLYELMRTAQFLPREPVSSG
ncbi:MAG: alpha/beta hydrolase [Cyanobacteria bacterium P01_A01_bin.114]